jgi:hypothetical protein
MSRSEHVIRSTFAIIAGTLAIAAASSTAAAQRRPRVAVAAQPTPPPPAITTPYPGATVTIDPRLYQQRIFRPHQPQFPANRRHQRAVPPVYFIPVPSGYSYYPSTGGGVTDANGRPLYIEPESAPSQYGYGLGTPDFSGSPYVVVSQGAMIVDFPTGDRRTVPSCAALSADRTPDGQPRTIFYRPGADGVILREGQRGRVIGLPPAGASACYTTDQYGRMELDWER